MTNTPIRLETLSLNFHVLHGAYGQKLWFSYDTLIAVKVFEDTDTVWVTPTIYSATTSKHLNVVKHSAGNNGYNVQVADSDDDLNGWAA